VNRRVVVAAMVVDPPLPPLLDPEWTLVDAVWNTQAQGRNVTSKRWSLFFPSPFSPRGGARAREFSSGEFHKDLSAGFPFFFLLSARNVNSAARTGSEPSFSSVR